MRDHRSMPLSASPWVRRFMGGATSGGRMLDVACGGGRHVALALDAGLEVMAVDHDLSKATAFAAHPRVTLVAADLEQGTAPPFAGQRFAVVVVTNYLWRPLLPAIVAAVADDGLLIYETFADGHQRFGRPSNPEFLLRPGELIAATHGTLVPLAFEHVLLDHPSRMVQRLCAAGPRHRWVLEGAPAA